MKTEPPIVLYDADCGFCRWSMAKLLAWDRGRRLRPMAIQSGEGEQLLVGLDEGQRLGSWHLIDRNGRRHSGGSAAAPLLRELRGGKRLARMLERFPGATERAYRWVVRHRSGLGGLIPAAAKRRAEMRIRQREAARSGPRTGRTARGSAKRPDPGGCCRDRR